MSIWNYLRATSQVLFYYIQILTQLILILIHGNVFMEVRLPDIALTSTERFQKKFTFSVSFSMSIDRGRSLMGWSLKMSPKPNPRTFLGWISDVEDTLPVSERKLMESPPSLSEPVLSFTPAHKCICIKHIAWMQDSPHIYPHYTMQQIHLVSFCGCRLTNMTHDHCAIIQD